MNEAARRPQTKTGKRGAGPVARLLEARRRRKKLVTIAALLGKEEATSPFRAPAALTTVYRYVVEPKSLVIDDWSEAGQHQAPSHLAHALRAQSYASARNHGAAAAAMAEALRAIIARRAELELTPGERQHYSLLLALGGTFLERQAHLAGIEPAQRWRDICDGDYFGARAVEAFPLEPYLQLERHDQLYRENRFGEAMSRLMQWLAIENRSREKISFAAIQAAVVALKVPVSEAGRLAFMDVAERLLEDAIARADHPGDVRAQLAYWLGRVTLVKAETQSDAAAKAIEAFTISGNTSIPRDREIAEGWLLEAKRLNALHVFRKSSGGAQDLRDAFLSDVDAANLGPVYPANTMISPRPRAGRIVVDLPIGLLGDKPQEAADAIIGEGVDDTRGTLVELRSKWQRRYGFGLRGVQLRRTEGPMRVLLDGQPISAPSIESKNEVADKVAEALESHLHKLIEPDMASDFGVKGNSWMPLVRLLLFEQATFAREALRAAVESIEKERATIIEAAADYRLTPTVRPLLWGRKYPPTQLGELLPEAEEEMLKCVGPGQMLFVPEKLSEKIVEAIKEHFKKRSAERLHLLAPPLAPEREAMEQGMREATSNDSSGPVEGAIIVGNPRVRPWLRILIAQEPQLLNVAVLSEKELSA